MLKNKSVYILVIAFILLLIKSDNASANLLVNPGFESAGEEGYTTGWTKDWNDNIFGTTDNPHSGTRAARNFWDGGMYQDVPVVTDLVYRFRAYLYTPSGGDTSNWGNYVGFFWMDENDNLVMPIGALWQCNIHTSPRDVYLYADSENLPDPLKWMTAPEGAVKARVRFGTWQTDATPANPTDFDDFYFDVVCEPATLSLFICGLVGLFSFKRKIL